MLGLPCSCEACVAPILNPVPAQFAPEPAPHVTAALESDPHSTVVYTSKPPQSHILNAPASPPHLSAPSRGVSPRPRLGLLIPPRPARLLPPDQDYTVP
eukprot:4681836-Pleurochrysis_carterae.AAC.1